MGAVPVEVFGGEDYHSAGEAVAQCVDCDLLFPFAGLGSGGLAAMGLADPLAPLSSSLPVMRRATSLLVGLLAALIRPALGVAIPTLTLKVIDTGR